MGPFLEDEAGKLKPLEKKHSMMMSIYSFIANVAHNRIGKMKRRVSDSEETVEKSAADLDSKLCSQYEGYRPPHVSTEIETISAPNSHEEIRDFFEKYVALRKPCKIRGVPAELSLIQKLTPSKIRNYIPENEILTIEQKNDGGFGSGARRLKMSFDQFMNRLLDQGDKEFYLTTQYAEDDPNNSEYSTDEDEKDQVLDDDFETGSITFEDLHDDFDNLEEEEEAEAEAGAESEDAEEQEFRIRELYQPPMTNLIDSVPETPEFLSCLIPQQINLWIGAANPKNESSQDEDWLNKFDPQDPKGKLGLGRNVPGGGSSSGLHHDHADNLYIPVSGHKRFTLFAPSDAAKMFTVGSVRQLFPSGVIDYVNNEKAPLWRQLRDDGAIVAEVYKKVLDADPSIDSKLKKKYQEFIDLDLKQQLSGKEHEIRNLDPPSFSRVPPAVVHLDDISDKQTRERIREISKERWPAFFSAHRISLDLKPGEMLYLPTGWFHEVTSYGSNDERDKDVHVAANYWFLPPTGHDLTNVYPNGDKYWPDDYAHTKKALQSVRQKGSLE